MLMQTPTNSQASNSNRTSSLHSMLNQLNSKINQISSLKSMISQVIYSQQLDQQTKRSQHTKTKKKQQYFYSMIIQFIKYFKNDVVLNIRDEIDLYCNRNMQSVANIINYYEHEIKKCKNYYQNQIWDLRQQIKRQYKVIALMKQEVQDLMVLMRYKDNQNTNQDQDQYQHQNGQEYSRQSIQNSSLNNTQENIQKNNQIQINRNRLKINCINNRQYATDLSIIQEQTQRTLQSSQRSEKIVNQEIQHQNQQSIPTKIEQKPENVSTLTQNNSQNPRQNNNQKQKQNLDILKLQEIDKNNYISSNHNINQHFSQDLTPKHTDRIQKQKNQIPSSSQHNSHNKSIFGIQSCQAIEEEQNKIYYHSNQSPVFPPSSSLKQQIILSSSKRGNKMHTAPSDNRKIDHLQSIFFLDDQPEQLLNKTSKLKKIGDKFQFQSHNQNTNGNRYLQHTQVSHHGDDQYTLFDEFHQKKNQNCKIKSKLIQNKSQGQIFSQCLSQDNKNYQNHNIERKSDSYKVDNSKSYDKRANKTNNKNMTYQENNEYIFKKFNKAIPICEFQTSASVPVPSHNSPLDQLSPNLDTQKNMDKSSTQNKPKTKQFLEQFRKTFNKCLKSMQVSKKNSTKVVNNSRDSIKQSVKSNSSFHSEADSEHNHLVSGVMTFGKSNTTSGYSSVSNRQYQVQHSKNKQNNIKQKQKHSDSQYHNVKQASNMKAVDHMLKQLQNSNKFVIGNKKIQLKYEGDKKNGIRNGNGILYYSNGLCYEGQFRDGVRHGYGILKFNHIQIYNGDWAHDQIEGQGKIRNCAIINKKKTAYSSLNPLGKWISYSGEFKNSKFQGSGTLFLQGGQKFVGIFQNGYACGEGVIYKKNGQIQQNYWKNNFQVDILKEKQQIQ